VLGSMSYRLGFVWGDRGDRVRLYGTHFFPREASFASVRECKSEVSLLIRSDQDGIGESLAREGGRLRVPELRSLLADPILGTKGMLSWG
jgi:hypothetical protein